MRGLSYNIVEHCQQNALGQILTSWGDFTYDQVIQGLREADDTVCEHENFIVWEKYSDETTYDLADIIEEVCDTYYNVAQFAFAEGQLNG